MFSFFKSCRSIHPQYARQMSTVKKFALRDKSQSDGYLIKFSNIEKSVDKVSQVKQQIREFIRRHPNSMFVFTTPTTILCGEYGNIPHPGHIFVLISQEDTDRPHEETIRACMSKRPDTTTVLTKRMRADDERFMRSYSPTVSIYSPRFTPFEEEMNVWAQRALSVSEYPLFVHIIPLKSELNIDSSTFQNNVDAIIQYNAPYSLHSTHHPTSDHLIPPANCIGAVHEAIFGTGDVLKQNMFCQEAVMLIMKPFVKHWDLYEELAKDIGLTSGIKPSSFVEENYRAAFTC